MTARETEMIVKIPSWSFSGMKNFEQCPRQYHELKVLKNYPQEETEAQLYGTLFHEAAEYYIRDGTPLPPHFNYVKSTLDNLCSFQGEKLCEYKMALTENLEPCEFDAPNVWWRGVADLIIVNRDTSSAKIVDYKTGKSAKYADTGQLELMTLALFKYFPEIKKVKAGLLFVVSKDFVKANYDRTQEAALWAKWLRSYERMKLAYHNNVWNPKTSGLCKKHCAVLSCCHNGRN